MVKEVLSSEANVNISSCSDERMILHASLVTRQGAALPKSTGVQERQVPGFLQGVDLQVSVIEGRTGTCRGLGRVKADRTRSKEVLVIEMKAFMRARFPCGEAELAE